MKPLPSASCDMCGESVHMADLVHYHQNTAYVDEASNWVTLCAPCKVINDNNWEAMWAEYYSGRC